MLLIGRKQTEGELCKGGICEMSKETLRNGLGDLFEGLIMENGPPEIINGKRGYAISKEINGAMEHEARKRAYKEGKIL